MCNNGKHTEYNVQCVNCGSVWTAVPKSAQWWRGKQKADVGKLDAVRVTGEECGCIKKPQDPDAPFRIFGFGTEYGEEIDVPFHCFTSAVRAYRSAKKSGLLDIWITGVSKPVEQRLRDW
jgi:hypothetical protein